MPNLKDFGPDLLAFFDLTPDLLCIAGKDGYFKRVNPSVAATLGYTMDELYARHIASLIHPDDRERTALMRDQLLNGKPLHNFENRYLRKDGAVVWLAWTSLYVPDKEIVFAIAKNVTEKKQREQVMEDQYNTYKKMVYQLKGTIEDDRRQVATELHEHLAQLAVVVKLETDWLADQVQDEPRAAQAKEAVRMLIDTIRRLSFSISPDMFHMLGFDATLEWFCHEYAILNSLSCRYTSHCKEEELPQCLQLDLFRICQEYMQLMHEASEIEIVLEKMGHLVQLEIISNGEPVATNLLTALRERVVVLNGSFVLQNATAGTKLNIVIDCGKL